MNIRGYEFPHLRAIISLTGKARSGKSTVAEIIARHLPGTAHNISAVVGWGDAVKEECAEITGLPLEYFYESEYKEDVRVLMQWWATDFKRNPRLGGSAEYWIDKLFSNVSMHYAQVQYLIIPDTRFDSEANAIREADIPSYILEVQSPDQPIIKTNKHSSEAGVELKYNDWTLYNYQAKGTAYLEELVVEFMKKVGLLEG